MRESLVWILYFGNPYFINNLNVCIFFLECAVGDVDKDGTCVSKYAQVLPGTLWV